MWKACKAPVLAAIAAALFVTAAAQIPAPAFATSGGTDKFGGHTPTEKSATAKHPAGVYHCHGKLGTMKREACDARALVEALERKRIAAESELTHAKASVSRMAAEMEKLRSENAALADRLHIERSKVSRARGERDVARRLAHAKTLETERAVRDMKEAEARAAGKGPAVSRRCKDAVEEAVDTGRFGWGSDAKESLRRGCLYEPG